MIIIVIVEMKYDVKMMLWSFFGALFVQYLLYPANNNKYFLPVSMNPWRHI